MKARVIVGTVLGLLFALSVSPRILAQDCNQILEHGIFNTSSTDSLSTKTQTLINWLSQSTFESFVQAKDSAARIGFAIEGIPIELGGHSRETDWHNYQASLQTLNFSDQKTLDQFSQTVISADKGIVDAWTACILQRPGVSHAVIVSSYDPKVFTVELIYQMVGPPPTTTIKDFTVSPTTVHCSPRVRAGSEISSTSIILNCSRQSAVDAVQVTGNTSKGPLSAKLPGLTPRAPIPGPFPIDQLVVVTAENVPTDFKLRNTIQHSGCSCDGKDIYFPDGPYNVEVNKEFLFRYDASPTWHGQGFDNFHGVINWGPASTTLHDLHTWDYMAIAGTLKVKFSKAGDYNVVVDIYANCLDAFYHCNNTCTARGTTEVHVK
jgi:hypothetical protein